MNYCYFMVLFFRALQMHAMDGKKLYKIFEKKKKPNNSIQVWNNINDKIV